LGAFFDNVSTGRIVDCSWSQNQLGEVGRAGVVAIDGPVNNPIAVVEVVSEGEMGAPGQIPGGTP
jgi:hypothetical protein